MRTSVCRAAVDDPLAAQGGSPLVLDQDGFHGPGFGIEADLARGGVLFPAVAGAGALLRLAPCGRRVFLHCVRLPRLPGGRGGEIGRPLVALDLRVDGQGDHAHGGLIPEGRGIGVGGVGEEEPVDLVLSRSPSRILVDGIGLEDVHPLVVFEP